MKPMDLNQFKKKITRKGYSIAPSKKHHVLIDKEGQRVVRFAIDHKEGGKRYVKSCYLKNIIAHIGPLD